MKKATTPFCEDADNLEFVDLVEQQGGFGQVQAEVAKLLGISPGQLSRIKNGERHASRKHIRVLREHVRELAKQRQLQSRQPVRSIFAIEHATLDRLSITSAVEAFRDLLWARATERGIPTTRISISSSVHTPDGGVDGSILDGSGPPIEDDELLTSGTRFQIKTGKFAPWQLSSINNELFGKNGSGFENLGLGIQETLLSGKRFVLVCTGIDPIDSDVRKARDNLVSAFAKCGYPDAEVEVWGQTSLIGLFQRYPSLCLQLLGHDQGGFRDCVSWSSDEDMQPAVHYGPEQQLLIDELRAELRLGHTPHLRLIGEPGVGKTRLALELIRADDLAPSVLYIRDGRSFLHSSFINELVRADDHRFVILVIDECPSRDRANIWNTLKSRCDRIRAITIDHGPDDSVDDKTRIVKVAPVGIDETVAILKDHGVGGHDAARFAGLCEGCPRVAHVLGENLRMDRADLLQTPATVEIWDRFVVGYDPPNSEEVELRRIVLRHVSLFQRFGFEPPVDDEARFIASLTAKCDPRLTWPRFQSIVNSLKRRRILQGATTLYITPRLLQLQLFREFWEVYGSTFQIAEALEAMPSPLRQWFVEQLRYADKSKGGGRAVEQLLGYDGILPRDEFPDDESCGRLMESLAETDPKATLRCLQRTVGLMDVAQLCALKTSRQWLVWTLDKIAVWEDCFVDAATLLMRLAESENATNSNNATGTLEELFSLVPGMGGTQACPALRLTVLSDALDSDIPERRRIGLRCCETALLTSATFRTVSTEHQGLRKTIEFWMPTTYGELWDAHRDVWTLLVAKLDSWSGTDRSALVSTLIKSAWSTMHIKALVAMVMDTLRSIALDPATDVKALVELTKRQLRDTESKLPKDVLTQLKSLCDSLDGHDFPSRLRRFVKHAAREDFFDDKMQATQLVERKLDELADEAIGTRELLAAELPWLVCEDSSPAYCFAFCISRQDPSRTLLPEIMAHQAAQSQSRSACFLSGYLAAVFARSVAEWEAVVEPLAENPITTSQFSDLVIASGMSDRIANRVIEHFKRGAQDAQRLERWWFDQHLYQLSLPVVEELLRLQLNDGRGSLWSNAVHMCHTYFLEKGAEKPLPEQLVFELLTHASMVDGRVAHSASYYWSRLAAAFLKQCPGRKWDLFQSVLHTGVGHWAVLSDLNTNEEHVLTHLLREDPETAFDCITEVYSQVDDQSTFGIQHWLSEDGHRGIGDEGPGPVQYIPAAKLFAWVDADIDRRGYWLARALPKTLDDTIAGRLTRDFIARYGGNKSISSGLYANFHSRGWCGKASDRYRELRDQARTWLVNEKDSVVIRWVENYIDGLAYDISRAEIDEERRL
jgi:hypothetical protein